MCTPWLQPALLRHCKLQQKCSSKLSRDASRLEVFCRSISSSIMYMGSKILKGQRLDKQSIFRPSFGWSTSELEQAVPLLTVFWPGVAMAACGHGQPSRGRRNEYLWRQKEQHKAKKEKKDKSCCSKRNSK